VAEVSRKALKATVTSEAVAVFGEAKAVANITYLHVRRNVTSVTSQVTNQQNTLLKSRNKHITSLASILLIIIRHPQPYTTKAF
jgi:hypothetical protein